MEADVVVLGGGAAGMAAAALAAAEGLRVILLEKTGQLGGTTATSGGMVWAPGNAKAAAIGLPDSVEAARRYLAQTVPGTHNAAARAAFLAHAAAAIDALEARTELRFIRLPLIRITTRTERARRSAGACWNLSPSTGQSWGGISPCCARRCRNSWCSAV
jgi:succinate dehydrogenase/fumarate reductase flavoprotein subunit